MENLYFTRKVSEGTVKRSHLCSFDNSIKLDMLVTSSKHVMDYVIGLASESFKKDELISDNEAKKIIENKHAIHQAENHFRKNLNGLRINGLPIIFEELHNCFDSEELMEVIAFVNGADMRDFKGTATAEKKS